MIPILIICVIISTVLSAPLQLHLLQPLLQQQQQTSLQEHLMALQQLQLLQRLNSLQYHQNQNLRRPLLILLPNVHKNLGTNEEVENEHKINLRKSDLKGHHGIVDDDTDSITIEAAAEPVEEAQKAILLIPNEGRFSIGDFISSIPFLPIEINVPDSISWIYNGISSIISGIGQRRPFRPQTLDIMQSTGQDDSNLRIKSLNPGKITPILLMPLLF